MFAETAPGVYRIIVKRSNVYLLAGQDLTLVDAGLPGEAGTILSAIRKIGRIPTELNHILITHAHMDHMGSLAALKAISDAKVVASYKALEFIQGTTRTWHMEREGLSGKLFKAVLFFMETFVYRYDPAGVDILCRGGEILNCFGGIKVLATPGHSPDSLCYYQQEKKMLFTGDALSGGASGIRIPLRMGCANYAQALQSVRTLAELDFDTCLFGHGAPAANNANTQVKELL